MHNLVGLINLIVRWAESAYSQWKIFLLNVLLDTLAETTPSLVNHVLKVWFALSCKNNILIMIAKVGHKLATFHHMEPMLSLEFQLDGGLTVQITE
jgi:hypothetical protein